MYLASGRNVGKSAPVDPAIIPRARQERGNRGSGDTGLVPSASRRSLMKSSASADRVIAGQAAADAMRAWKPTPPSRRDYVKITLRTLHRDAQTARTGVSGNTWRQHVLTVGG